jgi:hypothetical protein
MSLTKAIDRNLERKVTFSELIQHRTISSNSNRKSTSFEISVSSDLANINLHEPEEQTTQNEIPIEDLKHSSPDLHLELSFDVPDLDHQELMNNAESNDIHSPYQRNLHDLERLSNCIFHIT